MMYLSTNAAAPTEPRPGSTHELSQSSPRPSVLSERCASYIDGWEAVGEQQRFYHTRPYLCPGQSLRAVDLRDRGQDDVVIFDYSLNLDRLSCVSGSPLTEGGSPSWAFFGSGDDIFFRLPKDRLIEPKQFAQIINPTKESRLMHSRGPRLSIIDFPQCYDTSDGKLLDWMAEEFRLPSEGAISFKDAHFNRVMALPGGERFRTGISSPVPIDQLSELPKSSSSKDKFTLFVSFPYFGKSSGRIQLGPESESVGLLDFKFLGVDVPDRRVLAGEERDDIGEILVHQARYMIFDNNTMATFRSKEDCAKDQVPFYSSQERIGSLHAMIHMISNRTGSGLWVFMKLQASLCKLELGIDQMISDARTYEDNQGMEGVPGDVSAGLELLRGMRITKEQERGLREVYEQARQNNVQKRKQRRVRDLLASLNRLSASLFSAISVAERQISVLQDLQSIFWASYRTQTKYHQKRYPLQGDPFYNDGARIPTFSEDPEQIWPDILDTIDEVVGERESFIKKIKELIENMDVRRKILSGFLKFDEAKAVLNEKRTQGACEAIGRTFDISVQTRDTLVQQAQTLTGFAVVNTAFLPLNFCTSYFGMDNIKEFQGNHMSLRDFWTTTGPTFVGIVLIIPIIIYWKHPINSLRELRIYFGKRLGRIREKSNASRERNRFDVENQLHRIYLPPPEFSPHGHQRGLY